MFEEVVTMINIVTEINSDHRKQISPTKQHLDYLWSKVICFVLSHWDLPSHGAVPCALGIFGKLLNELVGVHQFGLRLFGATMWKLLIIEPFFQWKLNKIKNENFIGICKCSWCCWKAHSDSDLIKFISKLRCEKYWFLVPFVHENLNKLQKLSLEGKISWAVNVFTNYN
jgi:hypothetical protein